MHFFYNQEQDKDVHYDCFILTLTMEVLATAVRQEKD